MRKQTLYARRLRGDIGPLDIDPVRGLMSRIIAPAVCLTGEYQDYDEQDITKNFTIGSRMQVDDRVYYYAQAVAALANMPYSYRLAVSTDQVLGANDCLSLTDTTALGRTVSVNVSGFQGGVVPLDDLQGGYIEITHGGTMYAWRRIVTNTLAAGTPEATTITVDRPFRQIFPIGAQVSIHKSIYKNIDTAEHAALAGYAAAVGVPPLAITQDYFFWLQTYGPCFVSPAFDWPLAIANSYDVYYHSGGETDSSLGEGVGTTESPQRIGHVMGSGNYGTGAVFLELAA